MLEFHYALLLRLSFAPFCVFIRLRKSEVRKERFLHPVLLLRSRFSSGASEGAEGGIKVNGFELKQNAAELKRTRLLLLQILQSSSFLISPAKQEESETELG